MLGELEYGVLVSVKLILVKQSTGAVNQPGKFEVDIAANALAVKTGEQSG